MIILKEKIMTNEKFWKLFTDFIGFWDVCNDNCEEYEFDSTGISSNENEESQTIEICISPMFIIDAGWLSESNEFRFEKIQYKKVILN
jgi:hypothetical protein